MDKTTKPPKSCRTVALVGNPNCGKTTIFNGLTGGNHRIGNWPGVTVEKKEGQLRMTEPGFFLAQPFIGQGEILDAGHTFRANEQLLSNSRNPVTVTDLPGIYSLTATTEDERVARDFILEKRADLYVNILDAANLERNLYLTLQLRELGLPLVLVLNMMDMAENRGISLDVQALGKELGVPVVAMNGTRKEDIQTLAGILGGQVSLESQDRPIPYSPVLENWLTDHKNLEAATATGLADWRPARWLALQALENPPLIRELSESRPPLNEENVARATLESSRQNLAQACGEDPDILAAEDKYRFIESLCAKVQTKKAGGRSLSDRIDGFVMNRVLGLPLFFLVMYAVFWFTISVGGAFIDFFDLAAGALLVDGLGHLLWSLGSPPWLTAILASGIGSGLQTVATFIPIIFTMFLALTLLEDSGYMARAAFVMDRFMQFLGLPGKAFIPMIVGFGCTVPGIMGTRTLESTKDRFTTIFMTPFMSCGARLPVYALFVVALFPAAGGAVVFSIYMAGILLAVLTGLLLKNTVFKGANSHFIMELPPYHKPRLVYAITNSAQRVWAFILRAGVVISLAVGLLSILNSVSLGPTGLSFGEPDREDSVLSSISRTIGPLFQPMGIEEENWPATVGLFTGVFAKEVIVGTLTSLYAHEGGLVTADSDSGASPQAPEESEFHLWTSLWEALLTVPENLLGALSSAGDPLGLEGFTELDEDSLATTARLSNRFTPFQGYAYLLFILIYTPCLAAVGAAIREMGKAWGWGLAAYLLVLAWAVSTLFYQVVEGGSILMGGLSLGVLGAIVLVFLVLGRHMANRVRAGL